MANSSENPDRRRFLKGAAVSAAALVANAAPVAAEPEQPPSAAPRPAPAAQSNAQLSADTDPPPRRPTSSRIVERPASDFMVDVIKSLGFEYVACNPGSSFEGLHESIVNYGGNKNPEFITCCHEESSVALAQGYSAVEGKPMLGLAHSTVGWQHASMGTF